MPELLLLAGFDADVQAEYERLETWRAGAGVAFYARLNADIGQLRTHPLSGPGVKKCHVRRLLVIGCRYSVLYVFEGRRVVIHALIDQLADPALYARRLREITRLLPP